MKCVQVCGAMDGNPPGSPVHGVFQARILGWVDISFSRGSFWSRDWTGFSCISWEFFTEPSAFLLGNHWLLTELPPTLEKGGTCCDLHSEVPALLPARPLRSLSLQTPEGLIGSQLSQALLQVLFRVLFIPVPSPPSNHCSWIHLACAFDSCFG